MYSSNAPHSTITLENSARWAGALVFTTLLIAIGCSSVRTTDASAIQDEAASPEDERLRARAVAIHRDAIVIDGHNDVAMWIVDFGFDLGMDGGQPEDRTAWFHLVAPWLPGRPSPEEIRTHSDLERFERGAIDAQFFSVWPSADYYDPDDPTSGRSFARANDIIDALLDQARRHDDRMAIALDADDIRRIAAEGKLAMLFGVEGGHAIEHDLEKLRQLYARGVRYMTLTWSFSHTWADSLGDPLSNATRLHGGLTDFGREVVAEMNSLGMLVDISHVSDETFWDTLEVSRAPVIASHSSVRSRASHPRNLSDEMLRAIAAGGGLVMINFSTMYLDERKTTIWRVGRDWLMTFGGSDTSTKHVADHIDHVVAVAGIDHVGIGSDFDGTPFVPSDLGDVSALPNLTTELLRRGYSETELRKILGENLLRVLETAGG